MNLTCFERGNCAVRRYVFEEKGGKKETHGQVKTGQLVKNVLDARNIIGFRSDNRHRCTYLSLQTFNLFFLHKSQTADYSV